VKDYFKPEKIEQIRQALISLDHDCHASPNDGCKVCQELKEADDDKIIDWYYKSKKMGIYLKGVKNGRQA
jgi:hypothetical protein